MTMPALIMPMKECLANWLEYIIKMKKHNNTSRKHSSATQRNQYGNIMGEKIFAAELLLKGWASAIIDSEISKLKYDDMSSHEKPNHVRGGNISRDETDDERKIGLFMSKIPQIEWLVASKLWGPHFSVGRTEMYKRIKREIKWSEGRTRRFENYLLERVATEVV